MLQALTRNEAMALGDYFTRLRPSSCPSPIDCLAFWMPFGSTHQIKSKTQLSSLEESVPMRSKVLNTTNVEKKCLSATSYCISEFHPLKMVDNFIFPRVSMSTHAKHFSL
jgi:hypothetical protein